MTRPKARVLVISDQHRPFEHPQYLAFCKDIAKKHRCTRVVNIGDEWDHAALSRFDKDPDGMSGKDEYEAAIQASKPWYKTFPKMELCESNHGLRPFKTALKAGLSKVYLKTYREFMEAPVGWTWHSRIIIDGVLYFHGEPFAGERGHINAMIKNRCSVVMGHVHSFAGVNYSKAYKDQLFAMNVGCGINDSTYAFSYNTNTAARPVLGCGVVLEGKEAIFVPM